MRAKKLVSELDNQTGQMTVELCVVFPAVIAIAVIATNALSFFGYCAEFDRVSRNAVRTYATSIEHGQTTDQSLSLVAAAIEGSFDAENLECETEVERDYRGYETYRMTLKFMPTLFGMGMKSEVFGVPLPRLVHESRLTVDPYKPGMLF